MAIAAVAALTNTATVPPSLILRSISDGGDGDHQRLPRRLRLFNPTSDGNLSRKLLFPNLSYF